MRKQEEKDKKIAMIIDWLCLLLVVGFGLFYFFSGLSLGFIISLGLLTRDGCQVPEKITESAFLFFNCLSAISISFFIYRHRKWDLRDLIRRVSYLGIIFIILPTLFFSFLPLFFFCSSLLIVYGVSIRFVGCSSEGGTNTRSNIRYEGNDTPTRRGRFDASSEFLRSKGFSEELVIADYFGWTEFEAVEMFIIETDFSPAGQVYLCGLFFTANKVCGIKVEKILAVCQEEFTYGCSWRRQNTFFRGDSVLSKDCQQAFTKVWDSLNPQLPVGKIEVDTGTMIYRFGESQGQKRELSHYFQNKEVAHGFCTIEVLKVGVNIKLKTENGTINGAPVRTISLIK